MKSFLGATLLIGSYLILNSVNPRIVDTSPQMDSQAGVVLYEGYGCEGAMDWTDHERDEQKSTTESVPDLGEFTNFSNGGPRSLRLYGDPSLVDIVLYTGKNYQGDSVFADPEEATECRPVVNYDSMKLHWKIPGVYVCSEPYTESNGQLYCEGEYERHLTYDIGLLEDGLQDNLQGLKLVPVSIMSLAGNSNPGADARFYSSCVSKNGIVIGTGSSQECIISYYGVILHERPSYQGQAKIIMPTKNELSTINGEIKNLSSYDDPPFNLKKTSSITVLPIDLRNDSKAGGVTFYQDSNFGGDCYPEDGDSCSEFKGMMGNFGEGGFSKIPNADADSQLCITGRSVNGITSMEISGEYAVVLFQKEDFKGEAEVFFSNTPNLRDHRMGSCCSIGGWGKQDCASSAMIIPLTGEGMQDGTCQDEEPVVPALSKKCSDDESCSSPDIGSSYKCTYEKGSDGCYDWISEPCNNCELDRDVFTCHEESCDDYDDLSSRCFGASECFWYENECWDVPLLCDAYKGRDECEQPGQDCYFYDEGCHSSPLSGCNASSEEGCLSQEGCYWNYGNFVPANEGCYNTLQPCQGDTSTITQAAPCNCQNGYACSISGEEVRCGSEENPSCLSWGDPFSCPFGTFCGGPTCGSQEETGCGN